jgi:two-component system, chemotaxis family, sensor kinase CheA
MNTHQKNQEYREIFLAEALESYTEINRLLTVLEKSPADVQPIHSLFRVTHTLKGNAAGMGYDAISELAHVLEDLFGEIRDGRIQLGDELFFPVYKAADVLGELIDSVRNNKEVRYKGIKTKLEVFMRNARMTAEESGNQEGQYPSKPAEALEIGASVPRPTTDAESEDVPEQSNINISFSDLVQVPVQKLDNLLNLVSELVIERDRIIANARGYSSNEFARLNRISSDLQYSVMDVRLVQVGFLFNKFHRVIRDAANSEGKHVKLHIEGSETEIDRNILQVISDSMIHLIRNCVGHGIETPETRRRLGKPTEGTVMLTAMSESDTVTIQVKDDGAGIDPARVRQKAIERGLMSQQDANQLSDHDAVMLIFQPGFSTIDQVTSISGRGVGMDAAKKALDSIGGTIQVDSMIGEGTIITLTLPSSMAVKSTLLFELDNQAYALPLSYTESVISVYRADIHKASNQLITEHLGVATHLVFLSDVFAQSQGHGHNRYSSFEKIHPEQKFEVVVVAHNGKRVGLIVDKLMQQKEIVEKPLHKPYDDMSFLSGVTILGNGNVCLVLSVPGIFSALLGHQATKNLIV